MLFWTAFKAATKDERCDRITAKISALSLQRRALKAKQLKLTHEREDLLGQQRTATPRSLLVRKELPGPRVYGAR